MVTAIIFDMDGVLTDSEPVINAAAIRGLREYGVDACPGDFVPFIGTGEDRYIGGVSELYGVPYAPEMKDRVYQIYLEILPSALEPFAGVHELLDSLASAGITLALASSADRIKVKANLSAIGVDLSRFAVVLSGEDVGAKKPAPDIYLAAARRLGTAPSRCCVVEDAVNGIAAAKSAGMRCVAVATSFAADRLVAADRVAASLAEVSLADLGVVAGD